MSEKTIAIKMLVDHECQAVKCCAMCLYAEKSCPQHKDIFWMCLKIGEFRGETYFVEPSDICKLYSGTERVRGDE